MTDALHDNCKKCHSGNIVSNGHNVCGTSLYHCKDCYAYGVVRTKRKTSNIDKEALREQYLQHKSYRYIARMFNISHVTVMNLLKKD